MGLLAAAIGARCIRSMQTYGLARAGLKPADMTFLRMGVAGLAMLPVLLYQLRIGRRSAEPHNGAAGLQWRCSPARLFAVLIFTAFPICTAEPWCRLSLRGDERGGNDPGRDIPRGTRSRVARWSASAS